MKKYLLGFFAIALAIGFSSFKAKSDYTSTTFKYNSTDFSSGAVQNLSNWIVASASCSGDQNKPCKFTIDAIYSDGTHPQNVTILTAGDNNYVTDVQNSGITVAPTIVNKL